MDPISNQQPPAEPVDWIGFMSHPDLTVIVTVDTENLQPHLLEGRYGANLIRGEGPRGVFGTPLIMELLEAHGIRAAFFVNVYEYGQFGEAEIEAICAEIKGRGHDVELHTHPVWCYDRDREHMWQYTLDEQSEIIRHGLDLIEHWTGERPWAHRAGAYGANADTIEALALHDIPMDSSAFFEHPNCRIHKVRNRVALLGSVLEVPVTGFFRHQGLSLGPVTIPRGRRFIKTDIDWALPSELKTFIRRAREHRLRVMTLFLHSYSLMRLDETWSVTGPEECKVRAFQDLLARIASDPGIEILTFREFHTLFRKDPGRFTGSDHVPRFLYRKSVVKRFAEKYLNS